MYRSALASFFRRTQLIGLIVGILPSLVYSGQFLMQVLSCAPSWFLPEIQAHAPYFHSLHASVLAAEHRAAQRRCPCMR